MVYELNCLLHIYLDREKQQSANQSKIVLWSNSSQSDLLSIEAPCSTCISLSILRHPSHQMKRKILKLLRLLPLILLALWVFFSINSPKPKILSQCDFYSPLMKYEFSEIQPEQQNFISSSRSFNLVHPKDSTKRIELLESRNYATYELDGQKNESFFEFDENQCQCLKNKLKNANEITNTALYFTIECYNIQKCKQRYTHTNIHTGKNETLNRITESLEQASAGDYLVSILKNGELNQKHARNISEMDQDYFIMYQQVFQEPSKDEFESIKYNRVLSLVDCWIQQVKDVACDCNIDWKQLLRQALGEIDVEEETSNKID